MNIDQWIQSIGESTREEDIALWREASLLKPPSSPSGSQRPEDNRREKRVLSTIPQPPCRCGDKTMEVSPLTVKKPHSGKARPPSPPCTEIAPDPKASIHRPGLEKSINRLEIDIHKLSAIETTEETPNLQASNNNKGLEITTENLKKENREFAAMEVNRTDMPASQRSSKTVKASVFDVPPIGPLRSLSRPALYRALGDQKTKQALFRSYELALGRPQYRRRPSDSGDLASIEPLDTLPTRVYSQEPAHDKTKKTLFESDKIALQPTPTTAINSKSFNSGGLPSTAPLTPKKDHVERNQEVADFVKVWTKLFDANSALKEVRERRHQQLPSIMEGVLQRYVNDIVAEMEKLNLKPAFGERAQAAKSESLGLSTQELIEG